MRIDFQVNMPDAYRGRPDDLLNRGSYRDSGGLTARFQESLRLMGVGTAAADSPPTNDKIPNRSEAIPAGSASAANAEPPVSRWACLLASGAAGEGVGVQRGTERSHAATSRLVAALDDASGEGFAAEGTVGSRQATGTGRNSAAASGIRSTAAAADPAPVANPVATGLIHTPVGVYDPNSRVNNLVTTVAADSPAEAYFITHAPAEWKDDPEAVKKFTELYGAKAAAVLEYFGTVPKSIDPVWLFTPEQLARFDDEGNFLLSLQDYYHMTDEMAAMANFGALFPDIATDLPFIPSSQPFMAPSELANTAPALLAKLNLAAPAVPPATNGSHRGA